MTLAWIDIEATGLVATEHAILEVASIVTDDQLQELGRFHRVVHWPQATLLAHLCADSSEDQLASAATSMGIDRVVIGMHAKSGLWAEAAASAHTVSTVNDQLAEFLAELRHPGTPIAGSSIWLDRAFMAVHLPRALCQLHYKNVDVTTLNELARRVWPRLYQGTPRKREIHRAMSDIEDSLELCRYYAAQITHLQAAIS